MIELSIEISVLLHIWKVTFYWDWYHQNHKRGIKERYRCDHTGIGANNVGRVYGIKTAIGAITFYRKGGFKITIEDIRQRGT